ncbi:tape measure protein [Lysinibacillus macroides]|nr:tape measure protein [Lysinibacillus macroides]
MNVINSMNNTIRVMEQLHNASSNVESTMRTMTSTQSHIRVNDTAVNSAGANVQELMNDLSRLRTNTDMQLEVDATLNTRALQSAQNVINQNLSRLRELSTMIDVDVNTQDLERMQDLMQQAEYRLSALDARAQFDMEFDTASIERTEQLIRDLTGEVDRLERSANNAEGDVDDLGEEIEQVGNASQQAGGKVSSFFKMFAAAAGAYLSIQALTNGMKSFIAAADNATNIEARLNLINDGMQTTAELQERIFASAQATGGSYTATADAVGKLAAQAGAAFSSNDEIIAFTEQLNKTFSIAGTSVIGVESAMLQLTQAMAAGKLQGEELNAILDNAQPIVQNIADYMGVPVGSIKKLASEGQITADIIKNSMFAAAEETNRKFAEMPMTFGQQMQIMKDKGLRALEPLFGRFNDFVNSDAFTVMSNNIMAGVNVGIAGLTMLFDVVEWGYGMVSSGAQFIADTWGILGPIFLTAAAALTAYMTVLAVYRGIAMATVAIEGIRAAALAITGAYMMFATGATFAQTAAQWGLNAAIWAFPGTWILAAFIIAIVAVITALIIWGEQTATVISFIVGLFAALFTYIYNNVANVANFFLSFAEFLINLFIDPVYAIKKLFYDMAQMVMNNMAAMGMQIDSVANAIGNAFVSGANMAIGAINWIVDALNQIPGIDLGKVGKLSMSGSSVGNKIANMASSLEAPTSDRGVVSLPRMELGNYMDNVNSAMDWAYSGTMAVSDSLNGLVDKVQGLIPKKNGQEQPGASPGLDMESLLGNVPAFNADGLDGASKGAGGKGSSNPTGGKLDKIGKIEDEINIADEDLELFKEMATREAIRQVQVTLNPTVRLEGTTINNDVDVHDVIAKIENSISEEVARSAQGVYSQ